MKVKRSVGRADRIMRIILGVLIVAAGIIFKSWLGLFGIIPIITALTGSCGIYIPLGINTRKDKNNE
jgi:type IV secretory pathway TrbD component